MDINELKKLINEEVSRQRKQKTIKESNGFDPSEQPESSITTKYQDAISVIKFFMEEKPEPGSPAAPFIADLENMKNVVKQLEATVVSANTPEEVALLSKKIKDLHVRKTIAAIMMNTGMAKEKIDAFLQNLDPTVTAPEKVKAAILKQQEPKEEPEEQPKPQTNQSVSPTDKTFITRSGAPTNPGRRRRPA